ncbi:cytokine receptor common subunit beta isoform X2 [Scyliorhinus canicula]|uniref:cytokine receptor common subunit beta isoform X2 n=1 Tax=Scyliorhinus canicula TaxID=7830 RepID=UPI0018F4272B|nr:cytokine receptor common subunit beta isoform X2 [Scyliorhinus canicula]XP_038639554.1 cytokine receptor common subunit beta isoform X2 [Scyliorhinus canicula]
MNCGKGANRSLNMSGCGRSNYLCLVSILALTIVPCAGEVYDVARSLQCYTDYNTEIDCQWAENPMARRYLPMDLYYKKKTLSKFQIYQQQRCHASRSPRNNSSSDLNWRCTIKDKSYVISFKYEFTFKPERPVNVSKSFRLLENVKPQRPDNLSVAVTVEGDYALSWDTVYARNSSNLLFGKLQYDINYKRTWKLWENSITESVQKDIRLFRISKSSLATSDTYVARVRARPQLQPSAGGHWSEWSSEVRWNTTKNAEDRPTAEDEVMPKNLQCTYDGIQEIECTWEVPSESSKYFKFNLHYRKGNSETKECEQSRILRSYSHLAVHVCNIRVDGEEGLNDYQMSLKPTEPRTTFEPFKHIKPKAPFNMTVERMPDKNYQLKWLAEEAQYSSEYEVYFKKVEESWENANMKPIPQNTKFYQISKHSLEPSSRYKIRVRRKVKCGSSSDSYCGPWSTWSEEALLETEPDSKPIIIAAVCILMFLFILSYPCFGLIKSVKRSWLDSIPDPAKSKLFLKETQKGLMGYWAPVEIQTLEEGSICQVVADESLNPSPQIIPKEGAEGTQKEKEQGISSPPQTGGHVGHEQLYRVIETASPSEDALPNHPATLSEPADYNGPYLFNYQDLSESPPELKNGFNKNESYFKCDQHAPGYVKLPETSFEFPQALGQANGEQMLPCPTSMYVLNPPQPMSGSPSATLRHVGAGNASGTCLRQSVSGQLPTSISSYVLCPPLTNPDPTFSPDGYVHAKDAGVSSSMPPGSDGMTNPTAGPPLCAVPNRGDGQSLSAQQPRGVASEPLRWDAPTPGPPPPCLPKLQAGPQKPTTKEEARSLANLQKDSPNVILYQKGEKPLLLQQIGDYCFIPGSPPINADTFTKCHPSPSLANTESANKHSLSEGGPPFQSPYITSNNVNPL